MDRKKILIIDDEKNIRLALAAALEALPLDVQVAASGAEALATLEKQPYDFKVLLLDLLMPGIDGMEVLRRLAASRPDIKIIVITAHGSIDTAVEAMKLGAVDFLTKPFQAEEVRVAVSRVLALDRHPDERAQAYLTFIDLAIQRINEYKLEAAREYLRKAIALDPGRAEAFNVMGALCEIQGDRLGADKNYRAALSLDPTYVPAQENLTRITTRPYSTLGIVWKEPKATGS
jgi:FixJ family two-component response regulator